MYVVGVNVAVRTRIDTGDLACAVKDDKKRIFSSCAGKQDFLVLSARKTSQTDCKTFSVAATRGFYPGAFPGT